MKKFVKRVLAVLIVVTVSGVVLTGLHHWSNGRTKLGTIFLSDYTISQDGTELTIKIGNAMSMGFVRDIKAKQEGEKLYVDFYTPYGPLNSDWNAKDTFTLQIDESCSEIYFRRPNGEYGLILDKNEWQRQP